MGVAKNSKSELTGSGNETPIEELSFEQAVERLERIIDRVESGEAGLEESIREYELGTRLLRHCRAILARAEQRVMELTPEAPPQTPSSSRGASDQSGDAPF